MVIADYNGVREQKEEKTTSLTLTVRGDEIFVTYKDTEPIIFLSLLESIQSGEIVPIIMESIPQYGQYFDTWEDGRPLVRPTDDI